VITTNSKASRERIANRHLEAGLAAIRAGAQSAVSRPALSQDFVGESDSCVVVIGWSASSISESVAPGIRPARRSPVSIGSDVAGAPCKTRTGDIELSRLVLCWQGRPDRSALRIPRPILLRLRRRLV
jgi:hypothetical protein